jgi:hypothetical protein
MLMSPSTPATEFDLEIGLPEGAHDAPFEAQIWLLLCARTLTEVDASLSEARAGTIAVALMANTVYRELDAIAAAYLWLSRTQDGVSGDQIV